MFTPPPSPQPPIWQASSNKCHPDTSSDVCQTQHHATNDPQNLFSKRSFYSTIRWTVILVPLALMILAAFTRLWAHPAAFDLLSTDHNHEWKKLADWSLHEPHKDTIHHSDRISTSHGLVARNATTPAPTVPVNPTLSTPFPQPFDTTLSANFSTAGCYNVFLNMTEEPSFRSCRPFSLLVSTSSAFEEAQNNISLMNTDLWGTCNTDISQVQCDTNMSGFSSALRASCQTDLANQVETVVLALNALNTYDLMRNAACQVDSRTNSYCYVEAVANSDPSSYWFYLLPLGTPLIPNITTSACNECTSGLMDLYASALNSANGTALGALGQTYNNAVNTLNNLCGPSYAKTAQVSNSSSSAWVTAGVPSSSSLVVLSALVALIGVLCGS